MEQKIDDKMCRYTIRKEYFGAVIYDKSEYEYLFADETIYESLKSKSKEVLMDKIDEKFKDRALTFFKSNGKPDYKIIQTSSFSTDVLSAPLQVYYDMTTLCNLECKHCYTSSDKRSPDELKVSEVKDWANELSNHGVFKVSIGGGEPLMHPNAMEIFSAFRNNNVSLSLSTNGMFLTDEWIKRLNKLDLRTLSISIEGGNKDTYEKIRGKDTWERFKENLMDLKPQYNNRFAFRVTITKQTIGQVENILKLAEKAGAYAVKFKYLQYQGRALENKEIIPTAKENIGVVEKALELESKFDPKVTVPRLSSKGTLENTLNRYLPFSSNGDMPFKRRFGCGGGKVGLYVFPDGTYSACVSMGKEYDTGNLKDTTLMEAWHNGKGVKKMRSIEAPDECEDCEYLERCNGGCRARALYILGDPGGLDPYCPIKRNFNEKDQIN